MTLIVCIDDNNGMMFGRRRVSKDIEISKHIAADLQGKTLWLAAYSAPLFEGLGLELTVEEAFMQHAPQDACCFLENGSAAAFADRIDRVVLYRFNRRYPANRYFDLELSGFCKLTSFDFPGHSHDRITQEVYVR